MTLREIYRVLESLQKAVVEACPKQSASSPLDDPRQVAYTKIADAMSAVYALQERYPKN